ncbi:MAG: nucleotide exchange factor GrpE [Hydrogenophilus sp.]|nr:nucleotide exchange factor GrpE [Hydrogenophilus sp.]
MTPEKDEQTPSQTQAPESADIEAAPPSENGIGEAASSTAAVSETAAEGPPSPSPADALPDPAQLLRQLELKVAEHYDAWLRAKAEAENIRKRAEEEIAKARRFAVDRFAAALLPVKDSLEAALSAENQTVESLREGVLLTLKQLTAALEQQGIAEENPIGGKFDPNRHQAIGMIETEEGEPNQIAQVLQKGYLIHERVLRPALVMITKPRANP